jgi:hypothetical protein
MINYYNRDSFFQEVGELIKTTNSVLDIGCGIRPMNFFTPNIHVLVEPFPDYVKMLRYKYVNIPQIIIIQNYSLDFLKLAPDASFDSIFVLDVIEHLSKEDGLKLIKECERVARQQIIFFTPIGFEEQDCESEEKDGWGLTGMTFQQHRSGWFPEDFGDDYDSHICKDFHQQNWKGETVEAFGCFFAIKNIKKTTSIIDLPDNYENALMHMPNIKNNGNINVSSSTANGIDNLFQLAQLNLNLLNNQIDKVDLLIKDIAKIKERNFSIKRLIKNIKKEYQKANTKLQNVFTK